jgi:two-component system response regulator FlrC
MSSRILLVEDDAALREALADTLEVDGYDFDVVESGESALAALGQGSYALVISDVNLAGMDGHQLMALIKQKQFQVPVLLMTAFGSIQRAVDAMRQGAVDYLVKPFDPQVLLERVARHVQTVAADESGSPIAQEPTSRQLLALASRVARSDSTVLISGESGTGKEVLARYIHQQSARASGPFVAINCAAIPDNMLEATLFGHEKGAFTGAITAQPGKFELAEGGTILLDEVSEMPLGLQAKLLRVLQEREVERVGARKPKKIDIRILATTNRELSTEVTAGRFREDLYYRLSVFPLAWKPLRERPADILPLAKRLLDKHAKRAGQYSIVFSEAAAQVLQRYGWPGNVRELDNAIQRALILQQSGMIKPEDLCLDVPSEWLAHEAVPPLVSVKASPHEMMAVGESVPASVLGDDLRRREFELIMKTLRAERGRRKEAADRLGISARTLRYKLAQMREAGINIEAYLYAS